MATLKELREERLRKLADLKKLGVNPYPATSARTHTAKQVTAGFAKLEGDQVTVAGRIISTRNIGKLIFMVVKDASGTLQLFIKDGNIKEADYAHSELNFSELNLLSNGDFIEASGPVVKTQTGEISVDVEQLRILTKSLRPMPTSWDGFSNKEERFRRRYVDTNVNQDVYERFIRRSKFWTATREFLNKRDFFEINVPILEHTTGGADAKPFKTHMDAIDQDFYLRISHELPLKRLVGGGYEKVYDIGARFRNENYSDEHLPEHVAMEWYWAYADWRAGMELTKEMFRFVMKEVYGTLKFKIKDFDVDLAAEWEEIDYASIIKEHFGLDVFNCTLDDVKQQLDKHKIEVAKTENKSRGIDKLWKSIRSTIGGPAFLVNTPLFISPLSKVSTTNPNMVDRFQPIIAGAELGNGWSELNDPIDQLNRFKEQQDMREAGDEEAQMLDIDYVEMLEYGMPPACGYGHSERVFWVFEGVTAREGVPFPQLRAETDSVTRGIYPDIKL